MIHPLSDVIKAYINDERIQSKPKSQNCAWKDCFTLEESLRAGLSFPDFNRSNHEFRIKPKMKKFQCRLALFKIDSSNGYRYYTMGFDSELNSGIDGFFLRGEDPKPDSGFVRWLTDIIEFEVEDND